MEDPTSFELNHGIDNWQESLRRSPHFREEDLRELESHVRDSVAALRAQGLTDEEAFLVATRRLGKAAWLEPEFAKVNRTEVWVNRLLWMLIGIQAWGLVSALSNTLARAVVLGGLRGLGFHAPSGVGGLTWSRAALPVSLMSLAYLLVLAGVLAGCWRVLRRKERKAGDFVIRALRRPVLLGVPVALLLLTVYGLGTAEPMLLMRVYPLQEVGMISLYGGISSLMLMFGQTLAFVALTIVLLRRRLRPGAYAAE